MTRTSLFAASFFFAAWPALAQPRQAWLASPPGAVDASVTQANVSTTICVPGYTSTVRPSFAESNAIKHRLLNERHAAGLPGGMRDFELDHANPLALGGSPRSPDNLWLEPRAEADEKDVLEVQLARLVCDGIVPLAEAQQAIATDWRQAYRDYLGATAQ